MSSTTSSSPLPLHDPTAAIDTHASSQPDSLANSPSNQQQHKHFRPSHTQAERDKDNSQHDQVAPLPVEFPPGMPRPAGRQRRYSVSAESDRSSSQHQKLVIPKTEEKLQRIKTATSRSILFSGLDQQQLQEIYDVMQEKKVTAGEQVIKQFDSGDFFYVIDSGKFEVYKQDSPQSTKQHVFTYVDTGSFGELALMYNCPRAATVVAVTDGVLWRVDRETFRHIIIESQLKKRKQFEELITSIPILSKLNKQERAQVVDCLETKEFKKGDVVLREGDPGEQVYFILKGEAAATQTVKGKDGSASGKQVNVGSMSAGEYFGERALLKREPRAANVVCVSESMTCAVMDRSAFERLLGDVKEIMKRHADEYKKAEEVEEQAKVNKLD